MGWTLDPPELAPVVAAGILYAGRSRALRLRGRPVPAWKPACFAAGLAVLVVAVVSPIDTIGEERLFSVHMAQHLLIGDLAPLLVVLGLSGPLLRPVLAVRWVWRLRVLTYPLVALALWAVDLYLWHLPALYDGALRHSAVHAAEHACFFAGGLLLWTTLVGLLPAPRWFGLGARLGALAFVSLAGAVLANLFLWSSRPYYGPYVRAPRTWGLSALADQRAGGGVMLVEMALVALAVFIVIGLEWLAEAERRQVLQERRQAGHPSMKAN